MSPARARDENTGADADGLVFRASRYASQSSEYFSHAAFRTARSISASLRAFWMMASEAVSDANAAEAAKGGGNHPAGEKSRESTVMDNTTSRSNLHFAFIFIANTPGKIQI